MKNELVILLSNLVAVDNFNMLDQEPPEPRNDVPPPPPGLFPIDDHLWVLLVAGLFLGIYFLRKKLNVTA